MGKTINPMEIQVSKDKKAINQSQSNITDIEFTQKVNDFREGSSSLMKIFDDLKYNKIKKGFELEKVKEACDADLENFRMQVSVRLKAAKSINESVYDEMIRRARTIREDLISALTLDTTLKFDEADRRLSEEYEKSLIRCPLPDSNNPLINQARQRRIENCTEIFLKAIENLMNRVKNFNLDWSESGKNLLSPYKD